MDTLINNGLDRGFSSVIIVIDTRRLHEVTLGQLAAYVSFVGLAQINLDAREDGVGTILQLFRHGARPPQNLTVWDKALLYALYNSAQSSVLQVEEINDRVLKKLASQRLRNGR